MTPVSDAERRRILTYRREGEHIADIIAWTGLARETVRAVLRAAGLDGQQRRPQCVLCARRARDLVAYLDDDASAGDLVCPTTAGCRGAA